MSALVAFVVVILSRAAGPACHPFGLRPQDDEAHHQRNPRDSVRQTTQEIQDFLGVRAFPMKVS